jgi:PAS domain S-box-containing protein
LLEAQLRPGDYLTLSAANGEEALALIAQRAPDLILLDVMMPGMDGYQVASQLKANPATSSILIIMVTVDTDRSARVAGLNAGAEEFLARPVDQIELGLRVRNLLRLKELSDLLKNHSSILEQQVQARTVDLQRFRTAMDATADAILLVHRATMRFVEVNAAACNMLGYTREELLQMGPAQIPGDRDEHLEGAYDAIIAGHRKTDLTETRWRRKDGSQFPVEVRRDAHLSGADWIIVGVVRDITARQWAKIALQSSEREQRKLADQLEIERSRLVVAQWIAKMGSWEVDMATMAVIWSEETHRIFETDPATFHPTRQDFVELVHPEDRAGVDEAFVRSLDQHAACATAYRLLLPDGRIKFMEEHWHVFFDPQKRPVRLVGTCQDITERKLAENHLH